MPSTLLAKRHRAENRFRWYGRAALGLAVLALLVLLASIVGKGVGGLMTAQIRLEIPAEAETLPKEDWARQALSSRFPEAIGREKLKLFSLLGSNAAEEMGNAKPGSSVWVTASDQAAMAISDPNDSSLRLQPQQKQWLAALTQSGDTRRVLNTSFFAQGDSRSPESAGYLGAIMGSLFTLAACLLVAFPLGVLTAIYLEGFAPRNRFTDWIEVNINNLAAVPSIVFGLLGLAVYLNFFGLPRSAALVGGLTLALMILPTIIISTRAAIAAIPDSIRDGARALGASPMQVVFHHVVPLSLPGILTGTILGIARALGETAPLLMIGMVAFVADVPRGWFDPATVMPVQIYLWASSPESGFADKTAAGILVLIAILVSLNALAIYLRNKFEQRW